MNTQQRAAMQMALEALGVLLTCKHGEFCDHYQDAELQSKKAIAALREALAQPQGEPVAWQPIETLKPTTDELDILMGDGSILCNVLTQSDGDLWWSGSGTGEKFIDPKYAVVTHWRKHSDTTPPSVEAAVLAEREACAKVCNDYLEAVQKFSDDDYQTGRAQAALYIKKYIRARSLN